ncbi:SNF1-related protein kinase regulatory subunit beta-2-like [Castanea sativa]|uniref:SNF1-related protein kinase regulatory subunit beta-2-like n=1 Tax=Castanea sativa TaxID=21020 RepID=UPI003F6535DE
MAGWRKDGAGPSGVKNFENNNDHFMGFTEDYVFVTPMPTPREFIQSKMRHPLPGSMVHDENYFGGRLISVEITWNGGGNVVSVVGSWNNWQTKEDLRNIGKIASVAMMLPLGIHYFCFIVDGELKCAHNLPRVNNSGGDHYNMLYLQEDALQLAAPANANGGPDLSEFECPPSPPSSYNNQAFSFDELYYINEKGAGFRIEPPNLPQQLEEALVDMPPVPNHTQLNHLYFSKTNDADQSVMVSSTERFGARYVTRAAYKAASKTESCAKEIFFIE